VDERPGGLEDMVTPSADFWHGKRVLLTGHTGFKGSWCALWLKRLGAETCGLALAPATDPSLWEALGEPIGRSIIGDIRDVELVERTFSEFQPEIVIHMAAQALVRRSYEDPADSFDTNVMGLVRVLDAARKTASVRAIINVTSDKCYENREQIWPYRETDAMGGSDPYSASKGCSELVTTSYRRSFFKASSPAKLASGRAGNVIGGGDWSDDRLVPDCIAAFKDGLPVSIRNPLAVRPWQHVLEPVSGYLLLAQALFEQGHAVADGWNFGPASEESWSVERVVNHLVAAWGEGAAWEQDARENPAEAILLSVDATKARLRLGWAPRLSVAQALDWTVEWVQAIDAGETALAISERQIERFERLEERSHQNEWNCRFCSAPLSVTFADLGMSPVSNDFVEPSKANAMEPFYPLHALVCEKCFLVQLPDIARQESLFTDDYAYLSSYSDSWLRHAEQYALQMIGDEALTAQSLVVEVASNDGYLLQYFKRDGVPVLGIEPTANTAKIALETKGIESEVAFFGRETATRVAARIGQADVMAANNVLAHVPDINDFVAGFKIMLKDTGVANFEFPHLLSQITHGQFDTIYHEHFSYISLISAHAIFQAHGLRVYDVAELPTHGGSLRLFVCHQENAGRPDTARVAEMLEREKAAGLDKIETYEKFAQSVVETKYDLLNFLITARREGKTVAGYGAPAKGNTLLNFCGIREDMVAFTVDRSPLKYGKLLPGSRIPVFHPDVLLERKPDYVLILPWNLKDEIMEQMAEVKSWGGKFVTPIPTVKIYDAA